MGPLPWDPHSGTPPIVAPVPAHDLVCEEDPAHLWVLVLPLVDDGLGRAKSAQGGATISGPLSLCPARVPHTCPLSPHPQPRHPPRVAPVGLQGPEGHRVQPCSPSHLCVPQHTCTRVRPAPRAHVHELTRACLHTRAQACACLAHMCTDVPALPMHVQMCLPGTHVYRRPLWHTPCAHACARHQPHAVTCLDMESMRRT